jgi:CheY-like chemotaxis protein
MGKEMILVADDDPVAVEILSGVLRQMGLEVKVAFDAAQAWMFAVKTMPAAIILDFKMPAGDGLDVLAKLRKNTRTAAIPVLMISASTDRSLRERAMASGANAFLSKPLERDDLVAVLENLLGRSPTDAIGR